MLTNLSVSYWVSLEMIAVMPTTLLSTMTLRYDHLIYFMSYLFAGCSFVAEYWFQICGSPGQRYTHNKCCRWRNVAAWRESDHYRNYKRLAICHSYQNSGIIMCSNINDYIHCNLSLPFSVTVIQVYPLSHLFCLYKIWLLGHSHVDEHTSFLSGKLHGCQYFEFFVLRLMIGTGGWLCFLVHLMSGWIVRETGYIWSRSSLIPIYR